MYTKLVFLAEIKKQEDMHIGLNIDKLKFYIGDYDSIYQAMKGMGYVFHAVELKQLPSFEFYLMQVLCTNVIGTENVMNAATAN
tara:strand:+ start:711 stop:962 length:252 start_codon:yes stop_codon:yes gene_type:complete